MKKAFRLTRSRDFKRVKETGRTVYHPLVVLVYATSDRPTPHIAAVASKAIGNAVARNRVKRRLKSCLDRYAEKLKGFTDLVFYARKDILEVGFVEICDAIESLLMKADLLEK